MGIKKPLTLFKYLTANDADDLINLGSMRIGALYSFRDEEGKLDHERAAKLEGARQYVGQASYNSDGDETATRFLAMKGEELSRCLFGRDLVNSISSPYRRTIKK